MIGRYANRSICLGLLFFAFACSSTAPVADNTDEKPKEDIRTEHVGTVTTAFAEDGCDVLIQVNSKSEHAYLIPIALDDKYKKDGLVLKFNYRVSRAHQGDCKKGQAAILEDIAIMD